MSLALPCPQPMFAGIQVLINRGIAGRLSADQRNAGPALYVLAEDEYRAGDVSAKLAMCPQEDLSMDAKMRDKAYR